MNIDGAAAPSSISVASSHWQTSRFRIDLSRPRVMGIVNVTPDSFYAGSRYASAAHATAHAERLVAEGADILDIGGESSRPGATPLSVEDESARVMPVLEAVTALGVPISVDTSKPDVMRAALDHGADIVNDIRALTAPGALEVLAAHHDAGVCLMHMQGEPGTMQHCPQYADVVQAVASYLAGRLAAAVAAGIAAERIVLDPGIGFGKTAEHNFELLARQAELLAFGRPLLVGWSRKSSLGAITGHGADERLVASVAAALASVSRGARIVRVHDVAATVDALRVWGAAGLLEPATIEGPPRSAAPGRPKG
jgi:dihydropteroate synthase